MVGEGSRLGGQAQDEHRRPLDPPRGALGGLGVLVPRLPAARHSTRLVLARVEGRGRFGMRETSRWRGGGGLASAQEGGHPAGRPEDETRLASPIPALLGRSRLSPDAVRPGAGPVSVDLPAARSRTHSHTHTAPPPILGATLTDPEKTEEPGRAPPPPHPLSRPWGPQPPTPPQTRHDDPPRRDATACRFETL